MDWRPSASNATLHLRAQILARIRTFFAERGVLEVETPAISGAGVSDPALTNVTATVRACGDRSLYLHTSPEFAMKRLLAAGSGDIYQICRVFRDGELGRWHQPEFSMLEWYRVDWNDDALMQEAGELLAGILTCDGRQPPTVRVCYRESFERFVGADPDAGTASLTSSLRRQGIAVPENLSRRGLLDLAFSAIIVPALPSRSLTFIYDFPTDQAALARIKPTNPPVAARFEVFFAGIELGNGFWELTDAAEQRARFETELDERKRAGRCQPPIDEDFLAALSHGLPDCAGIAVGLDRLVAAAARLPGIEGAIAFVHTPPTAR